MHAYKHVHGTSVLLKSLQVFQNSSSKWIVCIILAHLCLTGCGLFSTLSVHSILNLKNSNCSIHDFGCPAREEQKLNDRNVNFINTARCNHTQHLNGCQIHSSFSLTWFPNIPVRPSRINAWNLIDITKPNIKIAARS